MDEHQHHDEHEPQSEAQRAGSVTLRAESERDGGMDAANASLRDALRISYRLLQGGIVVLIALYLFSGFQSIGETERGIRVLLGRIVTDDLRPGLHLSAPFPIGELVHIRTSTVSYTENKAFWPQAAPGQDSVEKLPMSQELDPARDGSVITGDGNLAHTRWNVSYARTRPADYARNILPEEEEAIVHAAVRQGVVSTIAGVGIDELLKSSADELGDSIAARAREVAQGTLDGLDSGIEITQLKLEERIPPAKLREKFNNVQSAEAQANKAVDASRREADKTLKSVGGLASDELSLLIDRYGEQLDGGEEDAAAETLATIDALLRGESVEIDGKPVTDRVTGEAREILVRAEQEAAAVANLWKGRLQDYEARRAVFEVNPGYAVYDAWASAYAAFVAHDNVQTLLHPPGASVVQLLINQDPSIVKDIEEAERLKRNKEAKEQREIETERTKYQAETGTRVRG